MWVVSSKRVSFPCFCRFKTCSMISFLAKGCCWYTSSTSCCIVFGCLFFTVWIMCSLRFDIFLFLLSMMLPLFSSYISLGIIVCGFV